MISLRRRRREQERREPSEKPRLQTTAHARRSSSTRLCVLRMPRKRQGGFLYTAPAKRKPAAGQRRPRAPQLLQEALCTAPATPKAARKLSVLPATRKPAAGQPRAAPPGGSVYCACHAKGSQEALCTAPAMRKPAAGQRPPRAPQLLQEALCTAPAKPKAARKLCVLRLPRQRQPGSSLYCTCHTPGGPAAPRRLCVLHLPHDSQPRASGAHARGSSSRRLCVLRLPRESACHAKGGQEALRTAPATRQPAAGQRRPRAPQLLQALCTALATQKAARKLPVLRLPATR